MILKNSLNLFVECVNCTYFSQVVFWQDLVNKKVEMIITFVVNLKWRSVEMESCWKLWFLCGWCWVALKYHQMFYIYIFNISKKYCKFKI